MKNNLGQEHRVCKKCPIHHVENCTTCFGFGLKIVKNRQIPIRCGEACEPKRLLNYQIVQCPECGGLA